MRRFYVVALAGALVTGLGLIQAGPASAQTTCSTPTSITPGSTVTGNLVVNGNCVLTDVTVTGNVTVVSGSLNATDSTIRGNLAVTGTTAGSQSTLCGVSIGGSVSVSGVQDTSGGWFRLVGPDETSGIGLPIADCDNPLRIAGNVRFQNNSGFVRLTAASVGGSVIATNNTSTVFAGQGFWIFGNTIAGNLHCAGNSPGIGGPNSVGGTVSGGQCFE